MLRFGPNHSLVMIYRGYINEVPFPCPRLGLYASKRLTIDLQAREVTRHSVAGEGPTTRSRTRRRTEAGSSHVPQQEQPSYQGYESYAGWEHPMGSQYEAGGSRQHEQEQTSPEDWRSQSARFPAGGDFGHDDADRFSYLANTVHTLHVRTRGMQETLQQHSEWHQEMNATISATNTTLNEHARRMEEFMRRWNPY